MCYVHCALCTVHCAMLTTVITTMVTIICDNASTFADGNSYLHITRWGKGREGKVREGREEKGKVSRSTDDTISTVGMNMRSTLPPCSQQKRCKERKEKEEGGEERDEDTPRTPLLSLVLRCQYDFVAGHDSHWRDTVEDGGRHLCGWAGLEVGIRSTYEWWAGKEAENVVIHYFICATRDLYNNMINVHIQSPQSAITNAYNAYLCANAVLILSAGHCRTKTIT